MVGERNRLRLLQVGVAGHDGTGVAPRGSDQLGEQVVEQGARLAAGGLDEHMHVEGDLIVAAAPGVESAACGADALGEHLFDEHVNVLGIGVERERARVEIGEDAV